MDWRWGFLALCSKETVIAAVAEGHSNDVTVADLIQSLILVPFLILLHDGWFGVRHGRNFYSHVCLGKDYRSIDEMLLMFRGLRLFFFAFSL